MTPFAQSIVKGAMRIPRQNGVGSFLSAMIQATCFDMSEARPLTNQVFAEILRTRSLLIDGTPTFDHGGLLFAPSPVFWLEDKPVPLESGQPNRAGFLVKDDGDELGVTVVTDIGGRVDTFGGHIKLLSDERYSVHLDPRSALLPGPDLSKRTEATSILFADYAHAVATCICVINAPRGVERTSWPAHKGLQRDLSNYLHTPLVLKPQHRIVISTQDSYGDGESAGSNPKAFHFCRSHVRRLARGGATKVRAHWRGNPALGVLQSAYTVRP